MSVTWRIRVGDSIQDQHIKPSFCTNDEAFELQAVLTGEVAAQLAPSTAAAHIRAGRFVPLLLEHMTDFYSLSAPVNKLRSVTPPGATCMRSKQVRALVHHRGAERYVAFCG